MIATQNTMHKFHIPVMGLGFTVDSPIKIAKYGISSVVSIMDDHLLEDMRRIYSRKLKIPYLYIDEKEEDYRAKRIKAYMNLLHQAVENQIQELKLKDFERDEDINQYFELLPEEYHLYQLYKKMPHVTDVERRKIGKILKDAIIPGSIDVNIMTKVDKLNYDGNGNELPREYSDALSALRGYAESDLNSSVVYSAGLNPALYSYIAQFPDFFPDETGEIKKRIILKVSDYRSALIQGRFLAKKGIWISEFRIESGLNCGGHAFATEGFLAGPILEEFKTNRVSLRETLLTACQEALKEKGLPLLPENIKPKITYQGGIGNSEENSFLLEYYQLDGTGWGSPFLLVPEATSVDKDTLNRLIRSKKSDYYLSHASPLGIPFNNLRISSGEEQRIARIDKNRPGSPCYKKFLTFSKEFSDKAICTASREYQNLKFKQYKAGEVTELELNEVLQKDCLCEGLSAPAILNAGETPRRNLSAVTICPGPNLAYFKGVFSLKEMVGHIYGKFNLNLDAERPHVFIKELQLYMQYLKSEMEKALPENNQKFETYIGKFQKNLESGIQYYNDLIEGVSVGKDEVTKKMKEQLDSILLEIQGTASIV